MESEEEARRFLRSLEDFLNEKLPGPPTILEQIATIVTNSKSSESALHTSFPEGALLNAFLVPSVHEYLRQRLSYEDATRALLCESYRHLRPLSSGSPARAKRHPFAKVIGAQPLDIFQQWRGKGPRRTLTVQSCPDMALRPPCPHKIVFEGKLFRARGIPAAEKALVTGIYEVFFYRGLPPIEESEKHPAWDYDYGCLLAYDATPEGTLKDAWESLSSAVKDACWDGASVYVMILRGKAS